MALETAPLSAWVALLDPEVLNSLRRPTLFTEELAKVLNCSRDTIERRRRNRTLPVREMPAIDGRPRYVTSDVIRLLHMEEAFR